MTYHFIDDVLCETDEILFVQLTSWFSDIWMEVECNYENMVTFYKWGKDGFPMSSNGRYLSHGQLTHTRMEFKEKKHPWIEGEKTLNVRQIKPLSEIDLNENIIHFKNYKSNYGAKIRDGIPYIEKEWV